MDCASCGTELIPGKRFCHACGAPARAACPHCGEAVETRFRFCPDCGGALTAAAEAATPTTAGAAPQTLRPAPAPVPEGPADGLERLAGRIPDELARKIRDAAAVAGERKQATVLFCDLSGSTEIAEQLDPEEYRELLDQYLELVLAEIYQYEGIVNQLAGDGLMALFGAPIAHEDAPERALHAALGIQAALQSNPCLVARIGVNTGQVVVGTVGNDLKMDYTAIGDTTNLAARLQDLAEPGSILVSDTTERLVRGSFDVEPIGPLQIRGKTDPVSAFRVVRARTATSPMSLARARGLTPWVGRDGDLAQLHDCFDRLDGSPQLASVIGDAGSGKSRLLHEFKRSIAGRPDTVLFEARCASLSQAVPFAVWKDLLRNFFGLRGSEAPATVRERIWSGVEAFGLDPEGTAPYLASMLDVRTDEVRELGDEELVRRTFDALTRLVTEGSKKGRVILIIEDLHWIDEPSRESLERAVAAMDEAPLMILVSHRPDYVPSWKVRVAFTQLHLRPLHDRDALQIIRQVAGGPLPDELEKRLLGKAEGNPFFAEELTRALVEQGLVVRENGGVTLARPVDQVLIPDTVQELVGARLDRLPPQAKRAAQVASVFGRQFARDDLARLLEAEWVDVDAELATLEERGVIHRYDAQRANEFRFGESFTQEVAYESLLLRERRQLHARVAEALEEDVKHATHPRYALLAHHYARSDDKERAVLALLTAAERSEALPSYPQALRLYGDAWKRAEAELGAASGESEAFRRAALRATLGLCRVMSVHGIPDGLDPEKPARHGLELAVALGDTDAQASLTAQHGMLLVSKDATRFDEAFERVEEGYALAEQTGSRIRMGSLGRVLGYLLLLDGRFDEAFATLDRALGLVDTPDEDGRMSDTYLGGRFFEERARLLAGRLDSLEDDVQATFELATRQCDRTVQSGSASTLAQLHLYRGTYEKALTWADRAITIGEEIGNTAAPRNASCVMIAAGAALGKKAASPRALEILDRSVTRAGEFALSSLQTVESLLSVGDLTRARRAAERTSENAGGRLARALAAASLGWVLFRRGAEHWTDARCHLELALGMAREIGVPPVEVSALLGLAELAKASGDVDDAVSKATDAATRAAKSGLGHYEYRAQCIVACDEPSQPCNEPAPDTRSAPGGSA